VDRKRLRFLKGSIDTALLHLVKMDYRRYFDDLRLQDAYEFCKEILRLLDENSGYDEVEWARKSVEEIQEIFNGEPSRFETGWRNPGRWNEILNYLKQGVPVTGKKITLAVAAQWFKVSRTTLKRLIQKGKLTSYRIGKGEHLVLIDDVAPKYERR